MIQIVLQKYTLAQVTNIIPFVVLFLVWLNKSKTKILIWKPKSILT